MAGNKADPLPPAQKLPEIMTLTDAKVRSFLDADEDLEKLGEKAKAFGGTNLKASAQTMRSSDEAMAILKKHGFKNPEEYLQVGYNAYVANNVLKRGGKKKMQTEVANAKKQQAQVMEKMRGSLSPEQVNAMVAQMTAGMNVLDQMSNIPDGNVELMNKYGSRMNAIERRNH